MNLILFAFFVGFIFYGPFVSSVPADPCLSVPCGKGAECKSMATIAVCVCPLDSVGDPFLECREIERSSAIPHSFTSITAGKNEYDTKITHYSTTKDPTTTRIFSTYDYPNYYHKSEEGNMKLSSTTISPPSSTTSSSTATTNTKPTITSESHANNYYNNNRNSGSPSFPHSTASSITTTTPHISHSSKSRHEQENMSNNDFSHRHSYTHSNAQINGNSNSNRNNAYNEGTNHFRAEPNHNTRNYYPESTSAPNNFNNNYRHDNQQHSHSGSVADNSDPLGQYKNCVRVNKVLVCADDDAPSQSNNNNPSSYNNDRRYSNSGGNMHHGQNSHSPGNSIYSNNNNNNGIRFRDTIHSPGSVYGELHGKTDYFNRRDENIHHQQNFHKERPNYHHHHENERDRYNEHSIHSSSSSQSHQHGGGDACKKFCAENAICRLVLSRPVCGCPSGFTGDASVKCYPIEENKIKSHPNSYGNFPMNDDRGVSSSNSNGINCQRHRDCSDNLICIKSKCIDPCNPKDSGKNSFLGYNEDGQICGPNATCLVEEHTPLCKCLKNHFGNPYMGCVL